MRLIKYFKIVVVLSGLIFTGKTYAQDIYGEAWGGGPTNVGHIFKINENCDSLSMQILHSMVNVEGENPMGHFAVMPNGKFYSTAQYGGTFNEGTIFEFNPATNSVITKYSYDGAGDGHDPQGGLIRSRLGKLYGVTKFSGAHNYGVVYEFDPATGIYRDAPFAGTDGAYPISGPMQASNGKLYGITSDGGLVGATLGAGVIYEYDTVNNVIVPLHVLLNAAQGANPFGRMVQATNGKLYGTTRNGGSLSKGTLFEYDIATNTYTKKADFNVTNGSNPEGYLMQATNGKLYGLTTLGGASNKGTLFEYDIATNTLARKVSFNDTINGRVPNGTLLQAFNGMLYGGTVFGGPYGYGTIFQYDIETATLTNKFSFNATNGANPQTMELIQICNSVAISSQSASDVLCVGDSIHLSINATGNNLKYQWFFNNDSIAGDTNNVFSFLNSTTLNSGYYYCKVQDTVCGVNSALMQITVTPAPNVNAIASANPVCYGAAEILHGTGAQVYTWNYNVNNNAAFSADSSRSYIVTGADANGCVNSDTVDIVVNPLPTVSAGPDKVYCPGANVTLAGWGDAVSYTWNNGVSNGVSFTIPSNPNSSYTYIVTGSSSNGCIRKDTVVISTNPLLTQSLCLVTVDSLSTHNVIIWEKPVTATIDSFKIYRVQTFTLDTLVGTVPYDSLSEFHDFTCDPNATQYDYKISTVDTCGNESVKSVAHRTIHMLTNYNANQVNLQWNFYVGQNINQYRVWRDSTMTGTWQSIATLSPASSSYTDNNIPGTAAWRYRVDVNWATSCTPTAKTMASTTNTTRSNTRDNYRVTALNNISASQVELYPNPATESININLNAMATIKSINVKDAMGRLISIDINNLNSNQANINTNDLAKGIYFVELNTTSGIVRKSFVKQ